MPVSGLGDGFERMSVHGKGMKINDSVSVTVGPVRTRREHTGKEDMTALLKVLSGELAAARPCPWRQRHVQPHVGVGCSNTARAHE